MMLWYPKMKCYQEVYSSFIVNFMLYKGIDDAMQQGHNNRRDIQNHTVINTLVYTGIYCSKTDEVEYMCVIM
jgi:hypothetical protein